VQIALRSRRHSIVDFTPFGYDERQFCSPGFNLPVGLLTRSPNDGFSEYHTSADNPDLVKPDALAETLEVVTEIVDVLDGDRTFENLQPFAEPQLGRRGLYKPYGSAEENKERQMAMLWVLNYSDGEHSLLGIAEKSGIRFSTVAAAADALLTAGLLAEISGLEKSTRD
jgi:aminopeptidase-like protein